LATHSSHSSFLAYSFRERFPSGIPANVRRKITTEAGRGIEKLGHAIDYLTDEFVHDGCAVTKDHGRLQAIQLMAALNRQLYFACGVEPAFRERVRSLFHRFSN
jgi:hypothetical protein